MPEPMILSEVRRMVEEMQPLNKKLEETEAAIDDYFKPINMEAEAIVKMQLEGEENRTKEMMNIPEKQAFLEKHQAEKLISTENVVTNKHDQDKAST
ncbi:hypothetical protein K7X08_006045 [Anisodus acutangulus]|uniref:Uncharacterized protein n=1 Tax=Anisodus acutangulus TaxID=402998 RepID=A0A9Q1LS38_9SOLA|nr:hypothetical protein K7X08_006045 [Anisodus acutangulus]